MLRRGHGFTSLQFVAIAFVLLVCLFVIGDELANIETQRAEDIHHAWSDTGNLARSLGQQAEDTVRIADLSIFGAAQRLEIDGIEPDTVEKMRQIMTARIAAFPALASFVVTDETGRCLAVSLPKMPEPCNLAGRVDFEYHRTHPDKGPRLSAPVRAIGLDTWIIPLSRRFNKPDGSFGGIVMNGISIPFFQSYYDTFDIGPNGSIVLARDGDDPVLLVRRPFVAANLGRSLRDGSFFKASRDSSAGTVETVSPSDGVLRLISYWKLDAYPLIVGVAYAKDDVLADWRANSVFTC